MKERTVLYKREAKLITVACCCMILVDNTDEYLAAENAEIKRLASELNVHLMKLLDIDYNRDAVANEIVEISKNVEKHMIVQQKLRILSKYKQAEFNDKFNYLLNKYKLI